MGEIRYKKINNILWIILIANLTVASIKIIVGSAIKSASMTADGFHSLTDGFSNIIGIIGITFASKPIDEDHPYGHSKFETLSGLFISGMLFFIGGKIIVAAINRFITPISPQITIESLIALIATLLINICVCIYEYNQGKKLSSCILVSDSIHTRSDIYVSLGVLATLLGVKLGLPPILDPIVSLIVSIFIIHASYKIFNLTSKVLVDKAVIEKEKIYAITLSFQEVKNVHKIRSRGSYNNLYIDMHIMTQPDMSVEESHALIHNIEKRLQQELCSSLQIIIHIEPYYIE